MTTNTKYRNLTDEEVSDLYRDYGRHIEARVVDDLLDTDQDVRDKALRAADDDEISAAELTAVCRVDARALDLARIAKSPEEWQALQASDAELAELKAAARVAEGLLDRMHRIRYSN